MLARYIDRKKIVDHIDDVLSRLEWIHEFGLNSRVPFKTKEDQLKDSSSELINVWHNLAKSGKLAAMQRHARKLYEAYIQQQE